MCRRLYPKRPSARCTPYQFMVPPLLFRMAAYLAIHAPLIIISHLCNHLLLPTISFSSKHTLTGGIQYTLTSSPPLNLLTTTQLPDIPSSTHSPKSSPFLKPKNPGSKKTRQTLLLSLYQLPLTYNIDSLLCVMHTKAVLLARLPFSCFASHTSNFEANAMKYIQYDNI